MDAAKKVIGIDCSSKRIDVVILDGEGKIINTASVDSDKKDMDARLIDLGDGLDEKLALALVFGDGFVAFVENPIYVNNIKATVGISQVVGVTKYILQSRFGVETFGVDNRSWKKGVLANGRADKTKIMSFAKAKWGEAIVSQDIADAATLALWGLMRIN